MNRPKTIAIVCNYALNPNRIGGMDRFYVAYDAQAKALGYKIDWYFSGYTPFEFYKNLTIYTHISIQIEAFFLQSLKDKGLKYDIVVTHFIALCTPFFKQIKETGVQQIIAVDHNPRPLDGFPLIKKLKNKLKGVIYSKYIDQFVGVSEYTKKHILKDYGAFLHKKTKVIYNGIDTTVFKKRIEPNTYKFIVTSHLRLSKGIQDLLKAVYELRIELKNSIEIDIYGEGPYEPTLKQLTELYQLTNQVHFKGSSSELNELLVNYSYLLQPTYMECFSLSILESLAANVPVITTTVGGNMEVVTHGENGFIFRPGDINALKTMLQQIMENTIGIQKDTSEMIETDFNLSLMVDNHLKLLV